MKNKILIIEDSINIRNFLKEVFENEKMEVEVLECNSYLEAKKILKLHQNFIFSSIVDIHLRDADNGEIIDLMNEYKIPTIVLTSSINKELENIAKRKKIIEYININDYDSVNYTSLTIKRLILNKEETIVFINNNLNLLNYYVHNLKEVQYNIEIFNNVDFALKYIDKNISDIRMVITEFSMKNFNVYNIIQKIRNKYSKDILGILVLSDINDDEIINKILKTGINDYMKLPISREEFYLKINLNVELLRIFKKTKDFANIDPLTGIHNRRFVFETGNLLLDLAKREERKLSYIMIDIDNFKKINDNYGHNVGDQIIISTSNVLKKCLRTSDLSSRWGGEEFFILLEQENEENIEIIIKKIQEEINKLTYIFDNKDLKFTVSIGIYIGSESELEEGIRKADKALYYSKNNGKNIHTFYDKII
jgi:diguanylate cyclase (GGDEF)-like protein